MGNTRKVNIIFESLACTRQCCKVEMILYICMHCVLASWALVMCADWALYTNCRQIYAPVL